MSRPDTYILKLAQLKSEINLQIMHCRTTLNKVEETSIDINYDAAATTLEKSNINNLTTLITNGLSALQAIVWEEEVTNG